MAKRKRKPKSRFDAARLGEETIKERLNPKERGQIEYLLAEGIPLDSLDREQRVELLTKVSMAITLLDHGVRVEDMSPKAVQKYADQWREDDNTEEDLDS